MPVRLSHTIVVCFWLATMGWLAVVKILPGLRRGERPDYYSTLDREAPIRPPDCWRIVWRDRTIGFAATDVDRRPDGQAVMRSVVQFDELPVQSMANELFGVLAVMLKPMFQGTGDLQIELLIASQMQFDSEQRFSGFTTRVNAAQQADFLVLSGNTDAQGTLTFEARMHDGGQGSGTQILKREVDLPAGALVSDALAPRPELKNLSVGQSWTVPVYRPFPPGSPPQIIQATVIRLEPIFWESNEVETMLVEYQSVAGSNINIASDPIGREWVLLDGTVVRQQVIFSGLKFQFDRLPEDNPDVRIELLDANKYPRLWQPAHAAPAESRQR